MAFSYADGRRLKNLQGRYEVHEHETGWYACLQRCVGLLLSLALKLIKLVTTSVSFRLLYITCKEMVCLKGQRWCCGAKSTWSALVDTVRSTMSSNIGLVDALYAGQLAPATSVFEVSTPISPAVGLGLPVLAKAGPTIHDLFAKRASSPDCEVRGKARLDLCPKRG